MHSEVVRRCCARPSVRVGNLNSTSSRYCNLLLADLHMMLYHNSCTPIAVVHRPLIFEGRAYIWLYVCIVTSDKQLASYICNAMSRWNGGHAEIK